MGYGHTSEGGSGSLILQEVGVDYIPTETCERNYPGRFNGDIMMCAGVSRGGKDSCQDDSGGPLGIVDGGDREVGRRMREARRSRSVKPRFRAN